MLPSAPKASRGPDVDLSQLPTSPPFTAYVANLPYELSDADIRSFFRDLKIVDIRLTRDESGRLKGYGCVDFEERESLLEALSFHEQVHLCPILCIILWLIDRFDASFLFFFRICVGGRSESRCILELAKEEEVNVAEETGLASVKGMVLIARRATGGLPVTVHRQTRDRNAADSVMVRIALTELFHVSARICLVCS